MNKPVTDIATYHTPFVALHEDKEPTRIIACGNLEGKMPAFQCINREGAVDWKSQDEFRVTDPILLDELVAR